MARSPIFPPGKISGRTTNESVVKASREPFNGSTAPSWRWSSMGLPNAGRKIFSMSWWVRLPPPPCARTMRSSATRGTGQLRLNTLIRLPPAIVVIGRAGALRRNHGSAERVFRRALDRKCRTLVRLLDALQNQPADALRRLARRFARKREAAVGIILLKAAAQLKAAGRNFTQTPPLAVHHLEDLDNTFLCGAVAFAARGARVLVLHFVAAFFQLADGHENAVQNVERLETGNDDGDFVTLRNRQIFFIAHDGADMACGEKPLNDATFRRKQRLHRGRNEHVRNQKREVVEVVMIGLPRGHGVGGSRGFEADGKENDLAVRMCLGKFQGVERRIDDANVGAFGLGVEQALRGAGHTQ